MKYSLVMGCLNSGHNLPHDVYSTLRIDGAFTSQQVIKRFTFDVLHYEKKHAIGTLAEVCYIDNVGMTNRSCRSCFSFKAGYRFAFLQILVTENVGTNSFDSYAASLQILISSEIDLTHRTTA